MKKLKLFIAAHKFVAIIVIIAIGGGAYWWRQSAAGDQAATRYVTAAVEKGGLAVSVSATGQVAPTNTLEIKPEATGTILAVKVKEGQEVKEGDILFTIDPTSARLQLKQALSSLAQTQSSYDKLVGGTAANDIKSARLNVEQAESSLANVKKDYANTVITLQNSVAQAENDLAKLRDANAVNTTQEQAIASAQEDLAQAKLNSQATIDSKNADLFTVTKTKLTSAATALDAVNKIFQDPDIRPALGAGNSAVLIQAEQAYDTGKDRLENAKTAVSQANTAQTPETVSAAYDSVYELLDVVAEATDKMFITLQATYPSLPLTQSQIDSYKSSMSSQNNTMMSALTSLESAKQAIIDAQTSYTTNIRKAEQSLNQVTLNYQNAESSAEQAIVSAKATQVTQLLSAQTKLTSSQNSLNSAQLQLENILAGVTTSEVRSAQAQVDLAVAQVAKAQKDLDGTSVKAPFVGQVAKVTAKTGDQAGAAALVTLITKQKVAQISLNETDIVKVKIGQKATLVFDALENLSLTGTVMQVDLLGTLTQNVVSYSVQILFDADDELVKPGMSVSASIITDVKQDILIAPSAAVKTRNESSYVEVLVNGAPQERAVTPGLSNDTQTEISGDIAEGDAVVTQTITTNPSAPKTAAQPTGSLLQGLGGGGVQRSFGASGQGGGAPIGR